MVYTFWNFACVTSLHFSSNQWTAGRGGKKTNIWLCFIIHYDTFVERTKEHKNTNIVHLAKDMDLWSSVQQAFPLFCFLLFSFLFFFFSLKNYMLYVFSSKWWKPCWYFIFLIMILNQIKILKLLQVFR